VPELELSLISRSPSLPAGNSPADHGLRRVLRLRDLVLLILGTVIGSGIFLVPGVVLKDVGNSLPLALSVWLLGGVLSLLGALTYGELSATRPEAGGLYIYIRDCFGRFPAFLFGWVLFFVVSTGSVATLAVAFSSYLGQFYPLGFWSARLISLAMIAVIALVNVRGTRQSADLQNLATAVKILAIVAMGALLLWLGNNLHAVSTDCGAPVLFSSKLSGIGLAMISVLWAYEGWQYCTFSAGETVNPSRDFPLAFLVGVTSLIVVYIFANLGYVAALGPAGVAGSTRVAAAALSTAVSPAFAKAVALVILVSIFSAAHSITLTSPRVYYAMAKDGLFFRRLAEIHPRFGTPAFAIATTAFWASVLTITGTFEQLLTYVVFVGWIFYALAAASIFVYRRRSQGEPLAYRVPGYPWTPLAFIATVCAFVVNTIVAQPARAAIGIGVVLAGAPAYFIWRKR
jgi:basic amino acid/polyamine antiporter, APA family